MFRFCFSFVINLLSGKELVILFIYYKIRVYNYYMDGRIYLGKIYCVRS